MSDKTKAQLQAELDELKANAGNEELQAELDETKRLLAEKPDDSNNATIQAENDELKAKITNMALQKGIIDITVDPEIEETIFIYKAVYARKLKIMKALIHNVSDGIGGYVREKVRDALYVRFEGKQQGAYFTLDKRVAHQKGLTVSEFKHHLEKNSQFGVEIELLISSKDEAKIKKFVAGIKPKSVELVSGIAAV